MMIKHGSKINVKQCQRNCRFVKRENVSRDPKLCIKSNIYLEPFKHKLISIQMYHPAPYVKEFTKKCPVTSITFMRKLVEKMCAFHAVFSNLPRNSASFLRVCYTVKFTLFLSEPFSNHSSFQN